MNKLYFIHQHRKLVLRGSCCEEDAVRRCARAGGWASRALVKDLQRECVRNAQNSTVKVSSWK